jgi:hypothetical protein
MICGSEMDYSHAKDMQCDISFNSWESLVGKAHIFHISKGFCAPGVEAL